MVLPPIDENAGWLSGIVFALFVLWKLWLRVKMESREDQAGSRSNRSEASIVGGYDKLIEQLRDEVDRLAKSVKSLSQELDEERGERYEAQRVAAELKARVDALERRLRELGQTP